MNEEYSIYGLLYNLIGVISRLVFAFCFFAMGILSIIYGGHPATFLVGIIFVIASIYIAYTSNEYFKNLKRIYSLRKETSEITITIQNIGYFIISLLFVYIMIMFVLMILFPNSNNSIINSILYTPHKYLIMIGCVGAILIILDRILGYLNKDTVIIKIKRNKKID